MAAVQMEIRRGRRVLESLRERDERDESLESEDGELGRIRSARHSRMRCFGRWCKLNLLRSWWMQLFCLILAAAMVVVVGLVVYKNAMSNKLQEILLKCKNRKEVSQLSVPVTNFSN